jgi:hypothetical protein
MANRLAHMSFHSTHPPSMVLRRRSIASQPVYQGRYLAQAYAFLGYRGREGYTGFGDQVTVFYRGG